MTALKILSLSNHSPKRAKNLKRGQFFRLKSGTITFFIHEHNLKFKVDN